MINSAAWEDSEHLSLGFRGRVILSYESAKNEKHRSLKVPLQTYQIERTRDIFFRQLSGGIFDFVSCSS